MTSVEAIKLLSYMKCAGSDRDKEAIDLAIEALKQVMSSSLPQDERRFGMTTNEAIKLLYEMKGAGSDWDTAIDLAIIALKTEDMRMNAAIQKAVKKSIVAVDDKLPKDYDWDKINKDLANAITAGDGVEKVCENCRYYTAYSPVSYKCQCCTHFLKDNWEPKE